MSDFNAALVVRRVTEAIKQGRAISFCHESPDHDYPEVKWQMFGLIDSNEVVVIARCDNLRLGIAAESWLTYPLMGDRVFGMDIADQELAMKLSEELWKLHSAQLIEVAECVRAGG